MGGRPGRRRRALRRPGGRRDRRRDRGHRGGRRRPRRRRLRPAARRRRRRGIGWRDEVLLFPEAGTNVVQRFASAGAGRLHGLRGRRRGADRQPAPDRRADRAPRRAPRTGRDDGRLVHYSACQGAHPTRDAAGGDLPPRRRRRSGWSCPTSAAGFGAKSRTYPEELALGFYARAVGRPVKWTETRSENMVAMPQGRGQVQYAKLGGTPRRSHHRLPARRGPGRRRLPDDRRRPAGMTLRMATGVYDIANVGFTGVVGRDERRRPPRRTAGPGRPEAAVAIERMVDRFAAEIGMDPAEVRRRNIVPAVHRGVHHRHRHGVRRRRLPRGARAGARRRGLRRAARRAGAPAAGRRHRRSSASASPSYVEITAGVAGLRVRLGRAARRRPPRGAHRRHAVRPGPRDDVGDDRGRPHRRADRPDRGAPRRHRPRPFGRPHRRVPLGAARRGGHRRRPRTKLIDAARKRAARPARGRRRRRGARRRAGRFHVAGTPARASVGLGRRSWQGAAEGRRWPASSPVSTTSRRRCRRSRSVPTSPWSRSTPRPAHVLLRSIVAVRRRRRADQPAAGRGADPRRHRPGRRPGADGGDPLRRGRHSRRPRTSPTTR